MSVWDERFTNHAVHKELAGARALVRKLKLPRKAVEAYEGRQRLDRVLEHVEAVLKAADPELTVPSVLDAVHQQITPLRQQVEFAENEEDPTYINSANQNADAMLNALAGITRPATTEDVERLREASTNFRQSVGQLLRNVRDDAEEVTGDVAALRTSVEEVRSDVEAQKARLDQALNESQERFSAAQTEREERFTASQDEHTDAMRTALEEAKGRLDEVVTASDERTAKLGEDLQGRADATLQRIAKLEQDAKRLVDVIGVTGMSGGYQEVADKEERQANRWRLVAAVSAGLAIGFNLFLILAEAFGWVDDTFEWDRQVPRVLLTLSLLAFASYAAVESSRHRRRQEINRQMEKELASLDPYMGLFSDKEKKEMKIEKFDFFFQGRKARPVTDLPPAPNDGPEDAEAASQE